MGNKKCPGWEWVLWNLKCCMIKVKITSYVTITLIRNHSSIVMDTVHWLRLMKYTLDTVKQNTADITFTNKKRFLNNTVIYSVNNTTYIGTFSEYCVLIFGLMMVQRTKTCHWVLILITNICCVIDWINYCIIAKHNGMAPTEKDFLTHKLLHCNASIIMTTFTLILIITTCFSCYFPGSYRLLSNVIQHSPYNTD
jgi:hypothetical protein